MGQSNLTHFLQSLKRRFSNLIFSEGLHLDQQPYECSLCYTERMLTYIRTNAPKSSMLFTPPEPKAPTRPFIFRPYTCFLLYQIKGPEDEAFKHYIETHSRHIKIRTITTDLMETVKDSVQFR